MPTNLSVSENATKDWFRQLFTIYEDNLNGERNKPIVDYKRSGFQQLMDQEFPNRKTEDWKYTNVQQFLKIPFQEGKSVKVTKKDLKQFEIPDLPIQKIVFVNGLLNEQLSELDASQGYQILSLKHALNDQTFNSWIQAQLKVKGGTSDNTFLALNQAFVKNGLVLKVDRNVKVSQPIEILYLSSEQEGEIPFFHPQLFVWCQKSSDLTVIEHYQTFNKSTAYWHNVVNRFYLEENARLQHVKLQRESHAAYQINNTLVQQRADSCYSSFAIDLGGTLIRNNISVELLGQGTETHLYGIYLANGRQHIDNQTFIDHALPHCQSNELYKGIITDRARGVFNGKVMVRQDAQKTNAFQQNSSLVLSPTAVMDAKPQLEIFADDVRCSHGATIGQLDESAIFYLRSRGIPGKDARNLLQQAFLGEVLENMDIEQLRDTVRQWIDNKLALVESPTD